MITGFNDFYFEEPGCHTGIKVYSAHYKLNNDISGLFPYIKAMIKDAEYHDNPCYIKFKYDDKLCALYPKELISGIFEDREQALSFFENIKDYLNDIEAGKESIEPDHTKFKHISVIEIYKELPKTNCGDCGYAACMAFADAVSKGETESSKCPSYFVNT